MSERAGRGAQRPGAPSIGGMDLARARRILHTVTSCPASDAAMLAVALDWTIEQLSAQAARCRRYGHRAAGVPRHLSGIARRAHRAAEGRRGWRTRGRGMTR
jgi:hypothetical protein